MDMLPARTIPLFVGAALACAPAASAAAQAPAVRPADMQGEEIVVTAQRSGIPVWRVTGRGGTAVLVGSIGDVAPGTKWNPGPLDAALARADRVMFPESLRARNYGLFSIAGALGKFLKQASLPKGQTLQALTTPEQWARLVSLRDRGVLKPGFERRHPAHLALALHRSVRDKSKRKPVPGADDHVRRFLARNKAKRVPLRTIDFKMLMAEYFRVPPPAHVACMMAAATIAEGGAAGTRARTAAVARRSAAWAARRVPEALAAKPSETVG